MPEAAEVAAEAKPPMTAAERVAEGRRLREQLAQLERTTGPSGAIPLTPKQQMLDASEVQAKMPGRRIRWCNVNNPDKMAARKAQGYERIPDVEGGRQVGNLALFALPRPIYEERVAANAAENKRRLSAHKTDMERIADGLARELHDRHGIDVSPERLLYKE